MARTIETIKKEMTGRFAADETVIRLYGLDPGKAFDEQFSKVSIESILFYIVAVSIWTLEKLFDLHRAENETLIDELKPHTLRWYVSKAKAFQYGCLLEEDSDEYDNSDRTEGEVEALRVVKYAAATEKAASVYIKVAGGSDEERSPLSPDEETALRAYFSEVKDAGVQVEIINREADRFGVDMDVYYNPQVFDGSLRSLQSGATTIHDAIARFVRELPFNGEFQNSALINALTAIDGVELIDLHRTTINGETIVARCVPESGYFQIGELTIKACAYELLSD